ncbi:hypothetical protein Tco_0719218 [Tanacetum coccineum]
MGDDTGSSGDTSSDRDGIGGSSGEASCPRLQGCSRWLAQTHRSRTALSPPQMGPDQQLVKQTAVSAIVGGYLSPLIIMVLMSTSSSSLSSSDESSRHRRHISSVGRIIDRILSGSLVVSLLWVCLKDRTPETNLVTRQWVRQAVAVGALRAETLSYSRGITRVLYRL